MFRRLRRASQSFITAKGRDSATALASTGTQSTAGLPPRASFLGLPPEIRNQIYECLAFNTTLLLPLVKLKRVTPVALLLVCRQVELEYRPLLLACATLVLQVSEYDFTNIRRMLDSLDERTVSWLRLNPQRWVMLHISHVPGREDRQKVTDWVTYRGRQSGAVAQLSFTYDATFRAQIRPPRAPNRYTNGYQMKWDLLRSHARMYQELSNAFKDREAGEISRMIEDMEECLRNLDDLASDRKLQQLSSRSI